VREGLFSAQSSLLACLLACFRTFFLSFLDCLRLPATA
jgi:hypothetical protein